MSKHKPTKHSDRPKAAAKAQRAAQAVVKSPNGSRLRSLGTGSTTSPARNRQQEALPVENTATTLQTEAPPTHDDPKQENLLVENSATALRDDCQPTMTDNDSKTALDSSTAAANVGAYQAKLVEMAQGNMQFALEFAQRLATIRSPFEFLSVIAEFTGKRIVMFQKYSKEMIGFTTLRRTSPEE